MNGIGRLEVFFKDQWGTVCDDGWDMNDANVACRQLGYKDAVKALLGSNVPDGSGKIWLDDVGCTGSEESLTRCSHQEWGSHNCGHANDAGVECSTGKLLYFVYTKSLSISYKCSLLISFLTMLYHSRCVCDLHICGITNHFIFNKYTTSSSRIWADSRRGT